MAFNMSRSQRGVISSASRECLQMSASLPAIFGVPLVRSCNPSHATFLNGGQKIHSFCAVPFTAKFLSCAQKWKEISLALSLHGNRCTCFRCLYCIHARLQAFEVRQENLHVSVNSGDLGCQPR